MIYGGCIIEDGDHQTLVNAKGVYAGMVALERLHRREAPVGDTEYATHMEN